MSSVVIEASGISKLYALGRKPRTFRETLDEWWRKASGAPAPRVLKQPETMKGLEPGPDGKSFWALKNVSFSIKQGEAIGVLGRNGAGKSTLLKILSRITEPTSGRISMSGRVISLLEVGTGFHPDLSGLENIYLNGAILGMRTREIRSKISRIVAFSELESFIDTPVKHYSSGMYIRLAFSVAAHLEPEILIVDEVLAVGDVNFQRKCLDKMASISKNGKTVFFTSHAMKAVESLTQRCLFLENGKLVGEGPTPEMISAYMRLCSNRASFSDRLTMVRPGDDSLAREVEFTRFDFANESGFMIPEGQPLKFRVTVKGNRDVENFRLSLVVYQKGGTPVGGVFGPETMAVKKGETAVFEVELAGHHLASGFYYCGVAAGTGDYKTSAKNYDLVHNVLQFEITETKTRGSLQGEWLPAWGRIKFPEPSVRRIG